MVVLLIFKDGDSVELGELLVRFDTRKAKQEAATLRGLIKLEKTKLLHS